MSIRVPPRVATWMLWQFGPSYAKESLAGDLLEEYQLGRTHRWYWCQVLTAVWLGLVSGLRLHRILRLAIEVAVLGAGTLTWAGGNPRVLHPQAHQYVAYQNNPAVTQVH